jgi:hypothetical protein
MVDHAVYDRWSVSTEKTGSATTTHERVCAGRRRGTIMRAVFE